MGNQGMSKGQEVQLRHPITDQPLLFRTLPVSSSQQALHHLARLSHLANTTYPNWLQLHHVQLKQGLVEQRLNLVIEGGQSLAQVLSLRRAGLLEQDLWTIAAGVVRAMTQFSPAEYRLQPARIFLGKRVKLIHPFCLSCVLEYDRPNAGTGQVFVLGCILIEAALNCQPDLQSLSLEKRLLYIEKRYSPAFLKFVRLLLLPEHQRPNWKSLGVLNQKVKAFSESTASSGEAAFDLRDDDGELVSYRVSVIGEAANEYQWQ